MPVLPAATATRSLKWTAIRWIYIDVSPKMMVSVATAMIPFLENDDANRALMGANMQRQAVPLLVTEAPIVATGHGVQELPWTPRSLCWPRATARSPRSPPPRSPSAMTTAAMMDYRLTKYRPLQPHHLHQPEAHCRTRGSARALRPCRSSGRRPRHLINGEIALGRNILMGFMTWEGYNYEDAVLLNERMVQEDVFTSIHIEEFETEARDTKLGPEEITRDIPNVGEDALKDLDERGIIRVGAEVTAGDILVGKVTPKGETDLTAEERLLRAIFGEKAREVRDTSLKVPHGDERHRAGRQGVHP